MKAPNILLVVADCLRADHAYGVGYTPAINALRSRGFTFMNCIAAATTTTPCLAALCTGRYPFRTGVRSLADCRLRDDIPTLAAQLKAQGYHTFAEVTGPLLAETGLDRGFDAFTCRSTGDHIHSPWGAALIDRCRSTASAPWFGLVHLWPLHAPRIVPPEYDAPAFGRDRYSRAVAGLDAFLGRLFEALGEETLIVLTADHGESLIYSGLHNLYRRVMLKADTWFGRGRNLPIGRRTRNYAAGHGFSVYDEQVKVPFILAGPGVRKGSAAVQVRQIDIAATLLEAAGCPPLADIDGISGTGIMHATDTAHREAYIEAVGITIPAGESWVAGLRVDDCWKYIRYPADDRFEDELYNLQNDPAERDNRIDKDSGKASELRQRMDAIQAGIDDRAVTASGQKAVMEKLKELGYF